LRAECACTAADTASWQTSDAADNFEVVRELTVFDNCTGQILFIAEGRMSINVDSSDSQLEIMVAQPDNHYEKHYVGLNETTTYVVRDISGVDVENFRYRIRVNPDMLIPFDIDVVDGGEQ
jgi:hypothetical protein